jgi:TonB family protein
MNRTQKKCLIVSSGLHLLLGLTLIFGPGFLPDRSPKPVTPIDFIPSKIIEGAMAGGGNPNANPPPPAPPDTKPPEPVVPPAQPVRTEQPKETPPPEVRRNDPVPEPTAKPAKHQIDVNTQLVKRKSSDKTTAKPTSNSQDQDRKRMADQVGRAAAGLKNNIAPTTSLELRGPGGGGETYAGVEQAILSTYDHVWESPEGMNSSEAEVEVSVTIESDGNVSSARITKPSGDARVDRSVQRALDHVSSIPGWDGKRRTVEFSFKSRANVST